ncbi:hypothetical protein [Phenylobacterium sp.]|uniref:hypothetical protein n=1 Tax=Phenylobacterium sp. TaxID=1871053 RepID=UPI00273449FB|nr:hypothetical protein [Phenylobacterium sp.]MDP3856107.1 hypothetical protein [Phenylobacterium sp.]
MFRNILLASLLVLTAACSQPARDVRLTQVAAAVPTAAQVAQDVRGIVEPCETAMDRASGDIGQLAAAASPRAAARVAVAGAKDACLTAFGALQKAQAPGEVRDACLSAVYTRETLADTAIEMLDGKAGALAITTLRYKADDQSAANRACATALANLGGREFAMAASPSRQ